jgi:hypothetical protein
VKVNFVEHAVQGLDYRFDGGVSEEAIHDAAMRLGVVFPPSYVDFLRRFGSGYISYQELIGLGGPPHLDVVELTSHLRERAGISRFQRHLVPVLADGFGNYDALDTSQPGPEVPVVQWLHDGGDDQKPPVLAGSYAEWLQRLVEDIRSVDLPGGATERS